MKQIIEFVELEFVGVTFLFILFFINFKVQIKRFVAKAFSFKQTAHKYLKYKLFKHCDFCRLKLFNKLIIR